jgi:hypothetical protein
MASLDEPPRWAAARRSAVFVSSALLLAVLCWPGQADAQESDDLRSKTQNPVGSLYSVPLENNFDFGAPNGGAYILNIQPVIPITVGGINLINRVIIPIASVQGFIEGLPGLPEGEPGDGATGGLALAVFASPLAAQIRPDSASLPELRAVWTDPDFDPNHRAVYYIRVLEIPTPTWQAYDAQFFGITMPEQVPLSHQERAYTSPIWYTP